MLVTEIKSLERIDEYNADLLIVPTVYSTVANLTVTLDQLIIFKNKKIALKIDKIFFENELIDLEKFIIESLNYNIEYYIFTDLAVYSILKKLNISNKAVYFSKTITCSSYDIKTYNELGIKCLASTEISFDEIKIISNLENNFIYCYGFNNIFYSKRKLLSLYKEYSSLEYEPKNIKYTILEETRKEHYPIYENDNGTFIFNCYKYRLFTEIESLNKNNFFYIDSTFVNEDDLIKIVNIYNNGFKKGFNEEGYKLLEEIDSNLGTGFLYLISSILKEDA